MSRPSTHGARVGDSRSTGIVGGLALVTILRLFQASHKVAAQRRAPAEYSPRVSACGGAQGRQQFLLGHREEFVLVVTADLDQGDVGEARLPERCHRGDDPPDVPAARNGRGDVVLGDEM